MAGLFITFEGTEGSGKSTQIDLTAKWLQSQGRDVITLREPGGTPIGEEIRHLLKHSENNHNMTSEAELLLMNASRAQLVREVIQPALAEGKAVLCDRFYDSTTVYQGHGRELDLDLVKSVIDFAVGDCRPRLTLLLRVSVDVSETRRAERGATERDRFEEAERDFFERVDRGYAALALEEPGRVKLVDATQSVDDVQTAIRDLIGQI
ncbi:MAG: dTMP kinase [Limisphaerales bacterium]